MSQKHKNSYLGLWWRGIDQHLVIAILILFALSLMLVTSAGPAVASRIGLAQHYFAFRQVFYLATGFALMISFSLMSHKMLKRVALVSFLLNIILLILVHFYGYDVKGARRWINLIGFSMQPSEFIKPFFAVVTGWILSLKIDNDFPSFTISIILYFIIATLLITQPDFGMLVIVTAVYAMQLFIAGMPIFWIAITAIMVLGGLSGAYLWLPHVAQRINSFLDPEGSENYQVTKSLLAFEQGGLYGKGPGEGNVKQVLPDSHTDFIFAVAGEEFGALICLLIIAVFAFIVIKSLSILIHEQNRFVQLAAAGLIAQIGFQSSVNMGVTLNLLPTKGMTLPFISYGGSSTIAVAIATGMLLSFTKKQLSLTKYKYQEIYL